MTWLTHLGIQLAPSRDPSGTRVAAKGWHLWLRTRRAGLRFIWLLPTPGDWADFRDLVYVWGFRRASSHNLLVEVSLLEEFPYRGWFDHVGPYRRKAIGHSLGGLLAKMMVSDSLDLIWNQFSECPRID
jgi:hypothetical protein